MVLIPSSLTPNWWVAAKNPYPLRQGSEHQLWLPHGRWNAKQKNSAKYSQHLYGKAADIWIAGVSVDTLAAYVETLMPNKGGIGVELMPFLHSRKVEKFIPIWYNSTGKDDEYGYI